VWNGRCHQYVVHRSHRRWDCSIIRIKLEELQYYFNATHSIDYWWGSRLCTFTLCWLYHDVNRSFCISITYITTYCYECINRSSILDLDYDTNHYSRHCTCRFFGRYWIWCRKPRSRCSWIWVSHRRLESEFRRYITRSLHWLTKNVYAERIC